MDAPVAIDEIKKFIAEQELKPDIRYVPKLLYQIGRPYPEKIAAGGFDRAPRQRPAGAEAAAAKTTFDDLRVPFTEEQLKTECARCLGCGTAVVDEFMCVGCGVCTTKCRFGAIRLEKIHDADNLECFHTLGRIVASVPGKGVSIIKKHIGKYEA